jgi:uncharacterized spore protein YtfJ
MNKENFLERFASDFSQSASVKNVFGEPIQAGEKIIIPVAEISYGFGGGFGQMGNKNKREEDLLETSLSTKNENEGGGGGGGLHAKAKGIYEITPTSTRFIPSQNYRQVFMNVAVGFLICRLFFRRRKVIKNK